jgi:A/G-specific adenine glycosylase
MKAKSSTQLRVVHFRHALLRWYRRHGRDLPWRRTRDPYRVAVSEFMLQQTQVARVEAYYHRFIETFPTLEALAAAPAPAVREAWNGLGYYRRATNLHALAKTVVETQDGRMPRAPSALEALPGVGRYTAGAIASFAFEQRTPAVDTNVERVIRRAFHPRLGARARDHQRIWDTAASLLPRTGRAAWAFNQGIMELGAVLCTARLKRCGECPVRESCATGSRTARNEK